MSKKSSSIVTFKRTYPTNCDHCGPILSLEGWGPGVPQPLYNSGGGASTAGLTFAVSANPLGDICGNPCLKPLKAVIVPCLAGVAPHAATFVEENIDDCCVDEFLL